MNKFVVPLVGENPEGGLEKSGEAVISLRDGNMCIHRVTFEGWVAMASGVRLELVADSVMMALKIIVLADHTLEEGPG